MPTAVTPLDRPTIQTLASLDRGLGPAEVRSASKALERSVEGLELGMASVLRDSYAPTATGTFVEYESLGIRSKDAAVAGVRAAR